MERAKEPVNQQIHYIRLEYLKKNWQEKYKKHEPVD